MCLVVDFPHVRKSDIDVCLRGRDIGMPHHFLQAPNVRTVLEHVGSETVTQGMRRDIGRDAGGVRITLASFVDDVEATPAAQSVDPADH